MGMFIDLEIDTTACEADQGCDLCARVCPVEAFRVEGGIVSTVPENEDECTLCGLCVEGCPGKAITVVKLY